MADENTTDSAPTTETTAPAAPPAPSQDTSTTPADDAGTTLLTGADPEVPTTPAGEDPAPEPSPEDAERAALFGAPEGDYELAGLPENTVIDTDALAAVTPIAKQMGLSNEGLSKLAGTYAEKILPSVTQQVTSQIQADSAATIAQWGRDAVESVKTDPAFQSKPLAEVQAASAKAIERFGGADLRQYLEDTGLGNHPAMLKAFFLAGSAIAEDTSFERGGAAPQPLTSTEKFYGKKGT